MLTNNTSTTKIEQALLKLVFLTFSIFPPWAMFRSMPSSCDSGISNYYAFVHQYADSPKETKDVISDGLIHTRRIHTRKHSNGDSLNFAEGVQ